MPMQRYRVNEVFYSLQGEGTRAGAPSIFVRFSGCNQQCSLASHGFDCDTEFVSGVNYTRDQLLTEIQTVGGSCRWIVLTGGEPGLQVDSDLVEALHAAGYKLAIETNGSIDVGGLGIDYIAVSPKVAEHAIRQRTADEVRYVRGYGQAIPKTVVNAVYRYISPAHNGLTLDAKTLQWCVALVKEHPEWKLSVQQHKTWQIQ
jgi:7-carboxy-7-deazaguanine synthase